MTLSRDERELHEIHREVCFACEVRSRADVLSARSAARSLSLGLGFDEKTANDVSIATSELAENLVAHALDGTLRILTLARDDAVGIEIETDDRGPGIANIEKALENGYSTGGTLGLGLGTVERLMDELSIRAHTHHEGTLITSLKWKFALLCPRALPLDLDVMCRPKPGEEACGDAFIGVYTGGTALVGVIDGVGHGVDAAKAAGCVRQLIESHPMAPLDELLMKAGRTANRTRGAVCALARIDTEAARLTLCGVGNIEARLVTSDRSYHLALPRGMLGTKLPSLRIEHFPWTSDSILVMHSDGISARWSPQTELGFALRSARSIVRGLFGAHYDAQDDATALAVVAKP